MEPKPDSINCHLVGSVGGSEAFVRFGGLGSALFAESAKTLIYFFSHLESLSVRVSICQCVCVCKVAGKTSSQAPPFGFRLLVPLRLDYKTQMCHARRQPHSQRAGGGRDGSLEQMKIFRQHSMGVGL